MDFDLLLLKIIKNRKKKKCVIKLNDIQWNVNGKMFIYIKNVGIFRGDLIILK